MPNFHSLGESQAKFLKSQFKNSEKKEGCFYSHEQACMHSLSNNWEVKRKNCFFCSWIKAVDKESIRLATKEKKPQYREGSNWPYLKEKRRIKDLLAKYGEWGSRTGKRVGKKYYVRVDVDLLGLPASLHRNLEKGFLMMLKHEGIVFIKTKKGYHVILLLNELPPNGAIYNVDKFGVKRKIGDILSTGRQAQEIGSPDKEQPTSKGKWFWQAQNIQKVSEIFAKYFFQLEVKEKFQKKLEVEENQKKSQKILETTEYPQTSQHNLNQPIISEYVLLLQTLFAKKPSANIQADQPKKIFINSAQIIKCELFKPWIKRVKPIYKFSYQKTSGIKGYFC